MELKNAIPAGTNFECVVQVEPSFYLEIYNDMKRGEALRKPIPIDLGDLIVLVKPVTILWMANTKKLHIKGVIVEKNKN